MSANLPFIFVALGCLVVGVVIYAISVQRNWKYVNSTNVVAWLFVALVPVFLVFGFFPQNSASGTLFGFSVSGAIAAFFLTWALGRDWSEKAIEKDVKFADFDSLKIKCDELQKQNDQLLSENEARHSPVLSTKEKVAYRLVSGKNKKIGIITGDIQNIRNIDAWVNSENTNMQMARFHDCSISGVIRWMGGVKDEANNVVDDIIAKELKACMGDKVYVNPATVLVTGSGELLKTNDVKKIFHVASVQGQVADGYHPIARVESCISVVLNKAGSEEYQKLGIRTILFPLLGAGHAKGDLKDTANRLIDTAVMYLKENANTGIEEVYFLAWTIAERDTCKAVLSNCRDLELA